MARESLSSTRVVSLGLLLACLCLTISIDFASGSKATGWAHTRQAAAPSGVNSTSLAPVGSVSITSLPKILFPAAQSLVVAPLRLLRQLLVELGAFLGSHNIRELFSLRFAQKIVARLPDRAATYWTTLVAMESQCAHRTVCDLASLTSRLLPKWAEQMALIYLNTFSAAHPYYAVAVQGITTHQCAQLYAECNPDQFLERVRGNVTESIAATVGPLRDAFNDLVTVATTTINSMTDTDSLETTVSPTRSNGGGFWRMRNSSN